MAELNARHRQSCGKRDLGGQTRGAEKRSRHLRDDLHALGHRAKKVGREVGVGGKKSLDFSVDVGSEGQVPNLVVPGHEGRFNVVAAIVVVASRESFCNYARLYFLSCLCDGATSVDQGSVVSRRREVCLCS